MPDLILVFDLGTSRLKASLFTPQGAPVASANADYPTYSPGPGLAEQQPSEWWTATVKACRALWDAGYEAKAVRIVSVTGQMHGVVPVGPNNVPLGPCLTLRDRRSADYAARLRTELGEAQIYKISGARLDASSLPAKFLWYRDHTGFFKQVVTFLAPKDWLRQQLTGGDPVTDVVEAAGMVIYDVVHGVWSPLMAESAGIRLDQMPRLCASTDMAGMLTPASAHELGLTAGLPVAVGAADDVEFLGAGVLDPGDCLEHLGSTGSLLLAVNQPVEDPTGTLELYPHLLPGRWLIGGSTSSAGAALDWLRNVLDPTDKMMLRLPPAQVSAIPLFIPYLAGERSPVWDPNATAAFWGLTMAHGQADLIRAVFEGVAFSMRHLFDALCSTGVVPTAILAADSDDRDWLQLRASAYNCPINLLDGGDPTARGAALIGACALGIYPDLESAARTVRSTGEQFARQFAPQVDAALATRYRAYQALSQLMLSSIRLETRQW